MDHGREPDDRQDDERSRRNPCRGSAMRCCAEGERSDQFGRGPGANLSSIRPSTGAERRPAARPGSSRGC
jgi:hypothetical protein